MREQRKLTDRRSADRRAIVDRRHMVVPVAIERRSGTERRDLSERRSGERRMVADRRGNHKGMMV